MKRQEVEEIVEAILDERDVGPAHVHDEDVPTSVIPVKQFGAFSEAGNPVEVIGVGHFNGMMQFLIIDEIDGDIFPIFRENVFRTRESALAT